MQVATCTLTQSSTLGVDFDGKPGKTTLKINGTVGQAFFEHVIYNSKDVLTTVANSVDITVEAGQTTLTVVCIFANQAAGAAELREDCSGNKVLDTLSITDPDHGTRTYVISA
jgi:hypothetical protein